MAELPSAATSKVLPTEATSKVIPADLRRRLRAESWQRAKQMRLLYLLFLLPLAIFVLFHYLPMYGNIIAFKDFRLGRGFWGSPWVGLQHFEDFSRNPYAWRIIRNTVVISGLKLLWGFPAPILLALLVNELTSQPFRSGRWPTSRAATRWWTTAPTCTRCARTAPTFSMRRSTKTCASASCPR